MKQEVLDYWHYKALNSRVIIEMNRVNIVKEIGISSPLANTIMEERMTMMKAFKNVSFYLFFLMKAIFGELNHNNKRNIRRHMPGYVDNETASDND